jgi:hypothetical protein
MMLRPKDRQDALKASGNDYPYNVKRALKRFLAQILIQFFSKIAPA